MKFTRSALHALPFAFVAFSAACAMPNDDQPTTTMTDDEISVAANVRACTNSSDEVHCHARMLVDDFGQVRPNATPAGLSPQQLRSLYGITSNGSTTTTVAIVDAQGYPNALAHLQTYRAQFGLPAISACSSGQKPCLAVVNQNCQTSPLPTTDVGWDQETALDLDMVSAMCPNCNILLVQGSSASFANLAAAANNAATCAATGQTPIAISNSYGGGEAGTTSFAPSYVHNGITVTASTGDSGFAGGPQFPATATTTAGAVLAVGGTSVHLGSTPRETVWSGGGAGCSTVYGKPAFQNTTAINAICPNRSVADIAAVGDPNTGVAVFAPTSTTAASFVVFGGTSVSAPLIAGIVGSTGAGVATSTVYARVAGNAGLVFDVTSGSDGTCSPAGRCTARAGYDGPTGVGTPVGPGAL